MSEEDTLVAIENEDGYSTERKQRIIEINDPASYDYNSMIVSRVYFINILESPEEA